MIGVPFDGGVTNRTGTRHGPREVRNQSSLMRKINQVSGIAPYELCNVADLGDADWALWGVAGLTRSLDRSILVELLKD